MATDDDLAAHARVMAEELLGSGSRVVSLMLRDGDGNAVELAVAEGPRGRWCEMGLQSESDANRDTAMQRLRERLTKAYRMTARG